MFLHGCGSHRVAAENALPEPRGESFDLIAKTGTGDARVVAAGIFQALVTTAAGLMVGIPTIALYSYFRRKAEVLVIELEEVSFGILQALAADRPSSGADPTEA